MFDIEGSAKNQWADQRFSENIHLVFLVDIIDNVSKTIVNHPQILLQTVIKKYIDKYTDKIWVIYDIALLC